MTVHLATLAQPSAADERSTEFQAVDGSQQGEQYSGSTLLVQAYAAIWIILMAWLFLLWRKQASLASRLDGLEAAIDRAAAKRGPAEPKKAPKTSAGAEGETTA